jgi:hypothetical protein
VTFEAMVASLMEQYGLDRPTAERRARAALTISVSRRVEVPRFEPAASLMSPTELHQRLADNQQLIDSIDVVPLEKDVQLEGVTLYEQHGCMVYNLSQARASKQSEGLPDSWIFPPEGHGPGWWHEWKRPGGARTTAQERFKLRCDESGTPYVCGGVEAAREMLRRRRIIPP